ncbi:hypothetical protein U1Q18_009203, partial [Sarracenia purpurea var. burkii]
EGTTALWRLGGRGSEVSCARGRRQCCESRVMSGVHVGGGAGARQRKGRQQWQLRRKSVVTAGLRPEGQGSRVRGLSCPLDTETQQTRGRRRR